MDQFFWLMCGLWVGIGGVLLGKFKAKEYISSGEISTEEVNKLLKGYAISIMLPCILFWLIQLSIKADVSPSFTSWPNPQMIIAVILQLALMALLVTWVFFFNGSKSLSKLLPLIGRFPDFMMKETSIKIGVIFIAASNLVSFALPYV